ncbi:MAG: glycosyltransferase family 4 protein [Candidatus Kerfeldbacteria bacterium]|nr:glycosyltransferase family 4 protein [Candidatus Kerfeldbacteria bacterium]
MVIGIDASRANQVRRTGTEWYAFHVINEIIRRLEPTDRVILYVKDKLVSDWPAFTSQVSVRILRWPPQFMWTQFRLAWEMLWHAPDVLFVPAHTIPIICPRKTITTLHDIGFEFFPELYSQHTIGPRWLDHALRLVSFNTIRSDELSYHRWSARVALRKAARIITVSEFSKMEIAHHYSVDPTRILVIPCGFNREYAPIPEENRKFFCDKYKLNRKFFLFIGRIEMKKNIINMVKGFEIFSKKHRDFDFVLAGTPGYGFESIDQVIQKSAVKSNIRQLGWLPTEEMPTLMNSAHAFIFVTAYEGFGIPNLEAMASGVPVLTSSHGATAEVVGDAALTVDPQNAELIAQAMERIAFDESLRSELTKKATRRIERFSWGTAGTGVLKVIKELV